MALACLPVMSWGQAGATPDTLRINLQEALQIALSDNPTIKIAEQEIQRVDYSKKAAWYGLFPTIDGTAGYTRNVMRQTMAMGGMAMKIGQDNLVSLGLSASLPLVVPALWTNIQMSEIDMQLAVEKARASKIDMRNQVRNAFYQALLAKDAHEIAMESYQLATQTYKDAKNKYEVGMAAEYDYVSAEVQMRNSYPRVLESENAVTNTRLFLKVLLGIDKNVPLAVTGTLTDFENELVDISAIDFSIDNNSDLQQLELQLQKTNKQLQLQKTQRYPNLVAFGSFAYQGMGNDNDELSPFTGEITAGGLRWYDPSLSVGVQLSVPIFHGLTNIMKEKQIKIAASELALQRDYLSSSLNMQVIGALDNIKKSIEQVNSSKENVKLAQKGHAIAQKRYETGSGTILELNTSALGITNARLSYAQAISAYLIAKANYEMLIGQ